MAGADSCWMGSAGLTVIEAAKSIVSGVMISAIGANMFVSVLSKVKKIFFKKIFAMKKKKRICLPLNWMRSWAMTRTSPQSLTLSVSMSSMRTRLNLYCDGWLA